MLARVVVLLIGLFAVSSSSWAGERGLLYQEYEASGFPTSIVAGPDGAMWFTNPTFEPAIGRIAMDGTMTSVPLTNDDSEPEQITLGPDGNLWFTDSDTNSIGRLTPAGQQNSFPVPNPLGLPPRDIVTGPDGNLWFTLGFGLPSVRGFQEGSVGRITPNGTVSVFPIERPGLLLTDGPDGALWMTSFESIGRVTTAGQDEFIPVDPQPVDITTGPDDALWFTSVCRNFLPEAVPAGVPAPCERNGIQRMTTAGELSTFIELDEEFRPLRIVRGPEDNLWFTTEDGGIWRTNLAGRAEFITGFLDGASTDIAVGPDGALWFTRPFAGKIGRLTSLPFEFINIADSAPLGMAPGLDGSVWFTDAAGDRVGRLSRNSLVQYELGPGRGPNAIAAAPDGGAFFTNFDAGTVGRITPDGDFIEFTIPFPDDLPGDIVLGPDGNYWFTLDLASIGRITPEGVITIFPTPTEEAGPLGIAVGADGNLWFTERLVNKIGRMTTDGDAVDFPIPTADSEPWDIAAAPDGALYFTERTAGRVARITTDGEITELGEADPTMQPRDIALGPDGALWYSIETVRTRQMARAAVDTPHPRGLAPAPAKLGRIAPDGRITTIDIPGGDTNPWGIAGSEDGFLFVAMSDTERIAAIELVAAEPTPTPTEPGSGPTATEEPGEETPTPTEEGGATATPTEEGGATATPTEPGGEPTQTETPSDGTCSGDCDGDFNVSIAELILAVNITLGNGSADSCPAADLNGDSEVRINELIAAVSSALQGC